MYKIWKWMCLVCEYFWCKLSTIVSLGVAFDHLEHYFFPCGKKTTTKNSNLNWPLIHSPMTTGRDAWYPRLSAGADSDGSDQGAQAGSAVQLSGPHPPHRGHPARGRALGGAEGARRTGRPHSGHALLDRQGDLIWPHLPGGSYGHLIIGSFFSFGIPKLLVDRQSEMIWAIWKAHVMWNSFDQLQK